MESKRLELANDRTVLVERVGAAMWNSRRVDASDPLWAGASAYWQDHLRQVAGVAVRKVDQ